MDVYEKKVRNFGVPYVIVIKENIRQRKKQTNKLLLSSIILEEDGEHT